MQLTLLIVLRFQLGFNIVKVQLAEHASVDTLVTRDVFLPFSLLLKVSALATIGIIRNRTTIEHDDEMRKEEENLGAIRRKFKQSACCRASLPRTSSNIYPSSNDHG